ncbi:MAG: hypothetical protein MUE81_08180 [Thermoflexibacter sp.]|jgi:hypothetical protein|nr:hypothetical protein [Thermoflexibacter sp.]
MELLIDLVKIVLPSALVLYGMYLTVKSFLSKDFDNQLIKLKAKNTEVTLPLRLQAYERMSLFLERMTPNNLLIRLNDVNYNVGELQEILLFEIRQEFNHNLSQQIYMSDEAWQQIKDAIENLMAVINDCASELKKDEPSLQLVKKIFSKIIENQNDITSDALRFIKNEVRNYF